MYNTWTSTKGKEMLLERGALQWGIKGEKWDNYNSIINKIYLKKPII